MKLFHTQYSPEVEVIRHPRVFILSCNHCFFLSYYDLTQCMFMDSSQNYWIYSEGTFTITAPNGVLYPQKGDVAVSDTGEHTYTHTSTPEEVIEKAEEHFLVYAVEKKKTKIQLDLNLKIQDRYLTLN